MRTDEKSSSQADTHSPAWFATTHWSVVLAAKGGDSARACEALEKLCATYWRPLYSFIRRNGYSPTDAQDLTQEFFSRLLAKDYLRHLQDQRGKFRSFLLTFAKHFLADERDKALAKKRGGGKAAISLDSEDSAWEERFLVESGSLSPDQVFEKRWAQMILENALARLANEYKAAGNGALYEKLKDLQPGEHGDASYGEIGASLGMSESAIKSAVHRLRKRHREILREEIAQTVTRVEDVDEEIRHFIELLGK